MPEYFNFRFCRGQVEVVMHQDHSDVFTCPLLRPVHLAISSAISKRLLALHLVGGHTVNWKDILAGTATFAMCILQNQSVFLFPSSYIHIFACFYSRLKPSQRHWIGITVKGSTSVLAATSLLAVWTNSSYCCFSVVVPSCSCRLSHAAVATKSWWCTVMNDVRLSHCYDSADQVWFLCSWKGGWMHTAKSDIVSQIHNVTPDSVLVTLIRVDKNKKSLLALAQTFVDTNDLYLPKLQRLFNKFISWST